MKRTNFSKPGYTSITCSKISNIPYILIFTMQFNDFSIWKFLGYFVWKTMILRKKIIFFTILGGGACRVRPPLDPPLLPVF